MQSMIPALTERQRFWLNHIQACDASGKTIAEYAAAKGFGAQEMYAGKSILVKKGVLARTQVARFQRVQVMEAAASSQWQTQRGNFMPPLSPVQLPSAVLGRLAGQDLQHRLCHLLVLLMPLSSTSCPGYVKVVIDPQKM